MRQVAYMARRDLVAPAMGQGAAYDQVHMPRQRRCRAQVVAVAMDLPAQLVTVRRMAVMLVVLRRPTGLAVVDTIIALTFPQPLALLARRSAVLRRRMVHRPVLLVGVSLTMIMRLAGGGRASRRGGSE